MTNNKLGEILEEIHKVTNFDARLYRTSTLKRRLGLRLSATNSKNYKEYLIFLKNDTSEYEKFLDTLTINVTDFFRDKRVFLALKRKILPDILKKAEEQNRKRILIWSIGCSKGQEPYSLAIILNEILKNRINNFQIIIHATDVNNTVLKKAKPGLYNKNETKNVPKKYLIKYFEIKDNEFKIKDNVRKLIRFRRHDLINENNPGKFHLILCRNLFIFFEPQLQEKIFKKIHSSLKKEGILVLGNAETPTEANLFRCIFSQEHIYQKII